MGKFRQCLTELSACDTMMVGYYSLTFLLWDREPLRRLNTIGIICTIFSRETTFVTSCLLSCL